MRQNAMTRLYFVCRLQKEKKTHLKSTVAVVVWTSVAKLSSCSLIIVWMKVLGYNRKTCKYHTRFIYWISLILTLPFFVLRLAIPTETIRLIFFVGFRLAPRVFLLVLRFSSLHKNHTSKFQFYRGFRATMKTTGTPVIVTLQKVVFFTNATRSRNFAKTFYMEQ